ncbi:OmpL47-type beta-barrel domain-containing protein [Paenibacillus hamazuiensis]|uniref:OmpL47-type beta-barrel domain-containing protein n=1 Tax=Paenibacillus hamazuiensis TaxID=2936508 RepID=UPI00200EC007|nr:stalk domain-containing protein [Paenibacillus hamazuiensis]
MRKIAVYALVMTVVMLASLALPIVPIPATAASAEAEAVAAEVAVAGSTVGSAPDPVPVGYLIDEDFSFPYARDPGEVKVSGWDIRRAGGSVSYGYVNWFKITDGSAVLPVSMNRKFVAQSAGTVTLEFRFKPAAAMDGTKWLLRSDSTDAVSVKLQSGSIVWEGGGGQTTVLQPYSVNTEYGVKIVADIDNDRADVYVNGALKASGAAFKQAVASLNNFQVQTGDSSTGELFFSPVKLYKGYVVNEKFISLMPGFLPQDWQTNAAGGTIAVQEMDSASRPDVYSLKLDAAGATGALSFAKTIPAQTGNLVLEYSVLIPQKKDGLAAELTSGGSAVLKLTTANGKLGYVDGSGQFVAIYDYVPNLWYKIKVKLNRVAGTADIYVNSKLNTQAVSIGAVAGPVDGVRFSIASGSVGGVMWLDDIAIYPDLPLPADYVPAPIVPSYSGDHLVGIQTCPLWREGHHLGWDPINPYTERTPYLGFYDEGSPETADWEIKWMAEHGVDFQLACWFRPHGGNGNPVKDPYMGFAINDGYMNSQYGDRMKFAIMWENGASSANGSSDFRNNLVPYWIEMYFKDPRYMKIDNKPVMTIYGMSGLLRDFGGTVAGVKAELDYLRSAVKQAGFADIVLLTTNSGTDPQQLSDRKAAGFDAIYTYSWGYSAGHEELQKEMLTRQSGIGAIDVLPTISMGRDDLPWGLSSGYFATPGEFQSVAEWVKNSYMPSLPAGNLGKRIVMLDDWNEFGEGHFIMPAGLAGFGYLDAIRNVFTDGGAHQDAVPTQAQKDRIDVLYPHDRVPPFRAPVAPPLTNDYKKSWTFESAGNSEGWSLEKQIDPLVVQNGAYTGTSIASDPGIRSADKLGIDAADVPYVKIRMKSSVASDGQLFFITDQDAVWDESKSVRFFVRHKEDAYTDYVLELYKNKKWAGKIRQLRFDPMTTTGQFAIDEIDLVNSPVPGIKLYVNDTLYRYNDAPQTTDGVPMVPGADVLKQTGAVTEWDSANQELIAVKGSSVYRLRVGQTNAAADGRTIALEHAPAALANGTVMIPASFFAQAFGYDVLWDAAAGTIKLSTKTYGWEFNGSGSEGWTANGQITGLQTANGELSGTSVGTDPYLTSSHLNYDSSTIKRIRIKLRNGTAATKAKLYFTTTDSPGWAETKRFAFDIVANDTTSREYVIDTTGAAGWSGTLDQLRFDPTDMTGSFAIDYIRLDTSTAVAVTGISLSKSAIQLPVNQSERLTATIAPANATNRNVTWSSDNSSVATVDASGNVLAKRTGNAYVTATSADGGLKASALVSVSLNAATGDNLVKDSGMEGTAYKYGSYRSTPTMSTAEHHGGSQSLQVAKTGQFGSVSFTLPIEAGQEYYYSGWFKLGADAANGEVPRLGLQYDVDGVRKQIIMMTGPKLTAGEWTQLHGIYAIQETGQVKNVSVYMYTDQPDRADTFYVDDFEVRKVTAYDSTPPVTKDDVKPGWQREAQTVTLSAADDLTGVAHTYYTVGEATYGYVEGSVIHLAGEGVHSLRYYSVDAAGNRESEHATTVKIDKTAPVVGWQGVVDGQSYTGPVTPTALASDALSGVASVELELDGQPWTSGTAIDGAGEHTLKVTATDYAGNAMASSVHFAIGSETALSVQNTEGVYSDDVRLHAVLTGRQGAPLAGRTVAFRVNGAAVGSAQTDAAGRAELRYRVALGAAADAESRVYDIASEYNGSSGSYEQASQGSGRLTVRKEDASIEYKGASFAFDGSVDLAVLVGQKDDTPGDVTGLPVRYALWRVQDDLTAAPVSNAVTQAVYRTDAQGIAAVRASLPNGLYIVRASLTGNEYYKETASPAALLIVYDLSSRKLTVDNEASGATGTGAGQERLALKLRKSDPGLTPTGKLHIVTQPHGTNIELQISDWAVQDGALLGTGEHGGRTYTVRIAPSFVPDDNGRMTLPVTVWEGSDTARPPIYRSAE